jgi:hypothetical protein
LSKKVVETGSMEQHIKKYFEQEEELSKKELVLLVKEDYPHWSDNTINTYLSRLKKGGIISTSSRGIYRLGGKIEFTPPITGDLIELYNKIHLKFPYITFCVWNSLWFSSFMKHQPFHHYLVVEVEKVAAEAVFSFLNLSLKNVFLNPDEEIFDRYISNFEDVVIVKNLISEAPLLEVHQVYIPAIEKLIVDIKTDVNLFSAQHDEFEYIIKSISEMYIINKARMERYAKRRNKQSDIKKALRKSRKNNS